MKTATWLTGRKILKTCITLYGLPETASKMISTSIEIEERSQAVFTGAPEQGGREAGGLYKFDALENLKTDLKYLQHI